RRGSRRQSWSGTLYVGQRRDAAPAGGAMPRVGTAACRTARQRHLRAGGATRRTGERQARPAAYEGRWLCRWGGCDPLDDRPSGRPHVAALRSVTFALEDQFGEQAKARPGRQHMMDDAYFARVDAIQFTLAHDDGIASEDWEEADILLAGVSRSSKTPTSIYLANRGYKVANIPLVMESPPPASLFQLRNPMVVGLTTAPRRLIEIRRNQIGRASCR